MSIKKLEYVEVTGNQVLDIDFIPNGNTTVECEYDPSIAGNQCIWSARNYVGPNNSHTMFIIGDSNYRFDLYGTAIPINVNDITGRKIIKTTKTSVQVGDVTKTFNARSGTSPEPMVLFASYATANTFGNYCNGKMYYFKVWDNGVLVRDLIPATSDNIVGMFDKVNNVFYPPLKGTLVAGPILNNVNGSIKVNGQWHDIDMIYIKTNGQWKEADAVYVKQNGQWKQSS